MFYDETTNGRPPYTRGGRHSCLLTGLLIVSVLVVIGAALTGLAFWIGSDTGFLSGDGVGVVEIKGVITDAEPTLKTLVRFSRAKNIKAVIVRIDSPGGGVAPTQEIYREIIRTRKTKKVIASLGNVAASGGLYVASATDKILANPATVTGSIGVIMQMINVENLLGKVGFQPVVIKSGRYKDMGSATRTMTDEERALLQGIVDELHRQFVKDVAIGRNLDEEKVIGMADGRIFTGEQALNLGLVDQLGNFEDAVTLAGALGGLEGRFPLIYPEEKKSWWQDILSGKSPVNILPEWVDQPLRFQYLYLPGI